MAASSPPRRRFLPEPVETTVRSSRRPHHEDPSHTSHVRFETSEVNTPSLTTTSTSSDTMPPNTKPRRFLPQPIEESTRTSRKPKVEHIETTEDKTAEQDHPDSLPPIAETSESTGVQKDPATKPARRFAPEPVETTIRSSHKKFTPEPVETTVRSSRKKFAPEPVETSTRSSKDKRNQDDETSSPPATRRRFLPEPVETTTVRRRRRQPTEDEEEEIQSSAEEDDIPLSTITSRTSSAGGRRWAPELIETARGSYRRSQRSSASTSPSSSKPSSPPPEETAEAADAVPDIEESRFSAANLAKRHHEVHRQHSFRVPDLPCIDSDLSEEEEDKENDGSESEPPSLSASSDSSDEIDRIPTAQAEPPTRETYTDYVLRLSAKAHQKQLQDQAMAAYINERPHEPVAHFAIAHDEDEDSTVQVGKLSGSNGIDTRTFRRESAADLSWELENMRKHHAQLEKAKRDLKENTAGQSRFSAAALLARQHHGVGMKAKKEREAEDDDDEWRKMRNAASPPMLGDDIVFPQTLSPKMTRCDVDQVPRPRTDDDDEEVRIEGDPQLWSTNVKVQNAAGEGLWMGLCQKSSNPTTRPATPIRSGIQTPAHDIRNPFESQTPGRMTPGRKATRPLSGLSFLPLTPPRDMSRDRHIDDPFTASIDQKLKVERMIAEEFPNRVITQIYNYISLGYPSLAHPFDEELSKISRIPIEELRKDDGFMDAKGYVGAPEGEGVDEEFVISGKCRRWEALRLYVREWARQSPQFQKDAGKSKEGDWGARVRRGSWAV